MTRQTSFFPVRNIHFDFYFGHWILSIIIVPAPVPITITFSPVIYIRPNGTTVNLSCTVELSPLVDVPVTVNTVWSGPTGVTLSPSNPVEVSSTSYTSTVILHSFGINESGDYTCTAIVNSTSSTFITGSQLLSGSSRITVGKL